ncbi:WD40 repeat domain-containing protein [Stieleria sp. JC731]|uniref:WD40 repeat domain-containing protein n=1 Tax=Pirellulaceae TaxID=2691357 RepID=UPI001E3D7F8E|nr:WD40 repeat domain-containing protein [Stieleria sp. JC731]MCC9601881.1 WD40 repeat domain-containing protein [Stieleria sp. JC731]
MQAVENAIQPTLNRRRFAAFALGGVLISQTQFTRAEEGIKAPASDAAYRSETPVNTMVRRLEPVSTDFNGAIIQAIAAGNSGKLLAVAGDDHGIRILHAGTLQRLALLRGHSDLIQSLQFDSTGRRLVSAGNDGELIIWNCQDWTVSQRMQTSHAFAGVRFAPNGMELAAVGFTDEVFIINNKPVNPHPRVLCDCTDLRSVEYRQDGKVLAVAGRSGKLHLFERTQYALFDESHLHHGRIHDMQFVGSSNVLASVGEDGKLTLFDTESKKTVLQVAVAKGKLYAICVIDEKYVAVAGSDDLISIVEQSTGKVIERLKGHSGTVTSLASIGSTLYSGGFDATLRMWQLDNIIGGPDRIAERDNLLGR